MTSGGSNIKVAIKVRPLIKREKDAKSKPVWKIDENQIRSLDKQYNCTFGKYKFSLRNFLFLSYSMLFFHKM
jgi:hypothetical protein